MVRIMANWIYATMGIVSKYARVVNKNLSEYRTADMSRITTRPICYDSKLDLALKLVQSAPVGYTGFDLHKPIGKGFATVTYCKGIDKTYLSVEKLAVELGIETPKRKSLPEPVRYSPSIATWLAVQQGKRGFVLLK